jgi:hypothetical protein
MGCSGLEFWVLGHRPQAIIEISRNKLIGTVVLGKKCS